MENFFDEKSEKKQPKIFIQSYSEENPLLIFVSKNRFFFLFSDNFYKKLKDQELIEILAAGQKKRNIVPLWLAGKVLAIRLLFIQFFYFFHESSKKIKTSFLREIFFYFGVFMSFLSFPIFQFAGWIYSKIWLYTIFSLEKEYKFKLQNVLASGESYNSLGYLMGTNQGNIKGYSLVFL